MNVAKINKCDQIAGNETMDKIIKLGHLLNSLFCFVFSPRMFS
jgi:hypothetical protein